MTRILLPRLASTPELLREQCRNPRWSGETRLLLWTWGHIQPNGHAPARPGELRAELSFSSPEVLSNTIEKARAHGLLDECSTARCLVLPGHSLAPCDQIHREAA